jgi:plastocyanin
MLWRFISGFSWLVGSRGREVASVTHRMGTASRWGTFAAALFIIVRWSAATPASGRDTGIIEGHVSYHGEIPAPTIVMEGGSTQHVLYVSRNGDLHYAVAFLSEAAAAAPTEQDPSTLRQSSFIFEPQVLAVREGQPVRFTNEDGANHNVRSDDEDPVNRFSVYTGAARCKAAASAPLAGTGHWSSRVTSTPGWLPGSIRSRTRTSP